MKRVMRGIDPSEYNRDFQLKTDKKRAAPIGAVRSM